MKPKTKNDVTLVHSGKGERIAFTMTDDPTHIMGLLTDAYKKPEVACLREYTNNGWDAHLEAQKNDPNYKIRPVEIELPTDLTPTLVIRDFGTGLSLDDMKNVYTKFGESTRRDSDDYTGMMGIGSKAALAYADQFTIVSIKDGVKTQGLVTRTATAVDMMIVKKSETKEPNGVTVMIPAKTGNNFAEEAKNLFKYWEDGAVLIDGKPVETVKGYKLSDKFTIIDSATVKDRYGYQRKNTDSDRHRIIMGNVPYPSDAIGQTLPEGKTLIARVDVGSFHFNPGREELLDTPLTQDFLKELNEEFAAECAKVVKAKLKKCKTGPDVVAALNELRDNYLIANANLGTLQHKGKNIPNKIEFPSVDGTNRRKMTVEIGSRPYTVGSYEPSNLANNSIPIWEAGNYIYVEDFQVQQFTNAHREKYQSWFNSDDSIKNNRLLLLHGKVPDELKPWIKEETIVSWKDVRKVLRIQQQEYVMFDRYTTANRHKSEYIKRKKAANPKFDPKKDLYGTYGPTFDFEQVDGSKDLKGRKVFYFVKPRQSQYGYETRMNNAAAVLQSTYPQALILRVEKNRVNKLHRLKPDAIDGMSHLGEAYDNWKKQRTKTELKHLYFEFSSNQSTIEALGGKVVSEPIVKKLAKAITDNSKWVDKNPDLVKQKGEWKAAGFMEGSQFDPSADLATLAKRYPLLTNGYSTDRLNGIGDKNIDDAVLYINSKYEQAFKSEDAKKSSSKKGK